MRVESVRTHQFRNLRDGTYALAPGLNWIVGANGQGKTNLLEAISVLSYGRSFRTARSSELIHWGEKAASVFATISTPIASEELGLALKRGERTAYLNQNALPSLSELLGRLVCVTFTPTDLALVRESAAERRAFIDRYASVLDPLFFTHLMRYQRAYRTKLQLLRTGEGRVELYEPLHHLMAEHGSYVVRGRDRFVRELGRRALVVQRSVFGADPDLTLAIESDGVDGETILAPEELLAEFSKALPREIERQRSLTGPHRDDMAITLASRDARAFASQGQVRSIVLALKFGVLALLEETFKESPVVLLDDVDSELDEARRGALFELVRSAAYQVIVTSTTLPAALRGSDVERIDIRAGELLRTTSSAAA